MHIFDVLQNRIIDPNKESKKLKALLKEKDHYVNDFFTAHTLFDVFEYLLRSLPLAGNFIEVSEFLSEKEFDDCNTIEQFSLLCEKVLTLLYQSEPFFRSCYNLNFGKYDGKEKEIGRVIDFDLGRLGLKRKKMNTEFGSVYVIYPGDPELLKAIEIQPDLAECIIDYSRPSNKGNLLEKEKALHFIIKGVEHIAQDKGFKYKKVAEQAETIFNMFHIRHDNLEGKKINPVLEKMAKKDLENTWDMGYRLALELIILNEFQEIDEKVDNIRKIMKEERRK